MAKTLNKIGITTGNTVEAYHVTQSIDAFTGTEAYDISLSGSFNMTGSINGQSGVINPLTASYAITASHALNIILPFIQTSGSTIYSLNPLTTNFSLNNLILLGSGSGQNTYIAQHSNFIGYQAGYSSDTSYSNFIGYQAGYSAGNTSTSANFIGSSAGYMAISCNNSNFIGPGSGFMAQNAKYSNFFGDNVGDVAHNASHSFFVGNFTGHSAVNASYSTLIGYQVGRSGSWGTIGSNNIIIGTNISLPNARNNSINLGGVIFATGSYSTTTGNPYTGSQSNSRVGIAKDYPNSTLDVGGNTTVSGSLTVTSSLTVNGTSTFNGTSSLKNTTLIGDGNDGTLIIPLNKQISTTNNTPTTLISLPTVSGVAYTVTAKVIGGNAVSYNIGGDVIAVFKNSGGTLSQIGASIRNLIEDFPGSPTFDLVPSGSNIVLQVTGVAATSITWAGQLQYISYNSLA